MCIRDSLLPAGHAEAAAAVIGAGTDAAVGAGQDGGDPDGRCASADHGWPHRPTVTLHRTRGRPGHPAPAFEDEPARPAAAQGDRKQRSDTDMTRPAVVPTLEAPPMDDQTLGRFRHPSSESRVKD